MNIFFCYCTTMSLSQYIHYSDENSEHISNMEM